MSIFQPEVEEKLPEGFKSLVEGYGKYAAEVSVNRALPAIDGFKVAQRRILYTMNKHKVNNLEKSANVCGKTLEFHPHSDASVYETVIPMVDSAEYTQFPFIHGKGNFSKVYFSDKDSQAAASRYTEISLSDKASTIFGEMDGVDFQPTEDGHTVEPVLLPSSFPNILTSATQGIAVGIACNIPSFNFNELLSLTIDYLKTGKVTRVIAPDFYCGGDYVLNNNALKTIMLEGRGQIKLRGRWRIEEKDIVITQIPYYARISDILSKAREFPGVTCANDETDLSGMRIRITCSNKNIVNRVLLQLLRDTGLQTTVSANIGVVIDNEPKFIGVIGVIEEWCKFRRNVLKRQYEKNLAGVRNAMRAPKVLIELIENKPLRDAFLDALKVSSAAAEKVLRDGIPNVDDDIVDYILDLKMRQFSDCEGRKRQYNNLLNAEKTLVNDLADLDSVIIRQLEQLNRTYKIPRRTLVSTNDYSFESIEEEKASVTQVQNYLAFVDIHDLYIRKMRYYTGDSSNLHRINNTAVLSLLDNKGRLLRVPMSSVSDCSQDSPGVYLPTLLGIPADFKIVSFDVIEKDVVHNYLYNDGYVSRLTLDEWVDSKRTTKMTERGLAPDHVDKMIGEIPKDAAYIACITKNKYLGIFSTDFKAKNRIARTKLGTVEKGDEIEFALAMTELEARTLLTGAPGSLEKYYTKCCPVADSEVLDGALLKRLLAKRITFKTL